MAGFYFKTRKMASKIYTKTGDAGKTSLIGGTKVSKSHLRIETYGTTDELNSYIGLVSDLVTDDHSKVILKEIQDRLFTIGSSLACDPHKEPLMKIPDLKEADVELLEREMDKNERVITSDEVFYFTRRAPGCVYHTCGPLCLQEGRAPLCKHAGA